MYNFYTKLSCVCLFSSFCAFLAACGETDRRDETDELVEQCGSGEPLFPPQQFGEFDLIRSVRVDPRTQDVYFSIADQIYSMQNGSFAAFTPRSMPSIFGDSDFWIIDDQMLIPNESGTLEDLGFAQGEVVLTSVPLAGGDRRALVGLPTPGENQRFLVEDVAVVGDQVVWLTAEGVTEDTDEFLPEYEDTYVVRATSWRSAFEHVELYRTAEPLNDIVVTEGRAFAGSRDFINRFERQVVLSLATGTYEGESIDLFGGNVFDADPQSLLVKKSDPDDSGLFLTHLDGTVISRVAGEFGVMVSASDGYGRWALVIVERASTLRVEVVEPDGAQRQVACFGDSADVYDLAFVGGDLVLATWEDQKSAIRRVSLEN